MRSVEPQKSVGNPSTTIKKKSLDLSILNVNIRWPANKFLIGLLYTNISQMESATDGEDTWVEVPLPQSLRESLGPCAVSNVSPFVKHQHLCQAALEIYKQRYKVLLCHGTAKESSGLARTIEWEPLEPRCTGHHTSYGHKSISPD